jgi:alkanesulfonate monooxygenase SsuD/methylene tetrahydromethanopterin reductase-like flavin-dependent oxidoreductase (luciferase family)
VRAELLDEGLDIVRGLWAGQPFSYTGRHFTVRPTDFMVPPPPVQRPGVPIWVVGGWPAEKSMRRAARADGWLPNLVGGPPGAPGKVTPDTVREGLAWIRDQRRVDGLPEQGYDVIAEGVTDPADRSRASDQVAAWADAGATWWIEGDWAVDRERVRDYAMRRLAAGPPH